jgi:LacI family repressor for deo operon, udp, cdd, tsx, nupC, and nupG
VATPSPHRRPVTIVDVARAAGVNKGTVSRALRGVSGVRPDTRERILAAADRLDFAASDLGTALATGFTRTVGIVLPTLRSWYFSEVASGATELLSAAGVRVELINLDIDSDLLQVGSDAFSAVFRQLNAGRSRDALLFAGTTSSDSRDGAEARVPASAHGRALVSVPGVFVDHREGGRLVAEHLTRLGHSSLAMIDGRMPGKADPSVWGLRASGFLDGVNAAGRDPRDVLIIQPGGCHISAGERAGMELLSSRPRPTAVFCQTDELAFGVIATLRRSGFYCPRDVSVAGFDDHPMSKVWDLTTVTQHAYEQGLRAAQALLEALGQAAESASSLASRTGQLQIELIVRDSTRPLQLRH